MLDKIIEKVVDWQKVCELLIIYVKKIDEIKNADENVSLHKAGE